MSNENETAEIIYFCDDEFEKLLCRPEGLDCPDCTGKPRICIPVDGPGGARDKLDRTIQYLGAFANSMPYSEDFAESPLGLLIAELRELQALLPGESEEP